MPRWKPDADEVQNGPRTAFADGIYIVTVHEGTPTDWLNLAASQLTSSIQVLVSCPQGLRFSTEPGSLVPPLEMACSIFMAYVG